MLSENIMPISNQEQDRRKKPESQDQKQSNRPGMNAHIILFQKPMLLPEHSDS